MSQCHLYWNVSPLQSSFLLLAAAEKLFELFVFHRLMKIFELQQCNSVYLYVTEINKAFSTRNDTDDEVSPFSSFANSFSKLFSSQIY